MVSPITSFVTSCPVRGLERAHEAHTGVPLRPLALLSEEAFHPSTDLLPTRRIAQERARRLEQLRDRVEGEYVRPCVRLREGQPLLDRGLTRIIRVVPDDQEGHIRRIQGSDAITVKERCVKTHHSVQLASA